MDKSGIIHKDLIWGQFAISGDDLKINWDGGYEEIAKIIWVDTRTIRYKILNHTDKKQIGWDHMFRKVHNEAN